MKIVKDGQVEDSKLTTTITTVLMIAYMCTMGYIRLHPKQVEPAPQQEQIADLLKDPEIAKELVRGLTEL